MADAAQAFGLLVGIARGATSSALPLPAQESLVEFWRGLAFNIGATRLLSAIGDVVEVIELPHLTRVPGTADWLMGVANVRGRLVPIVDLCTYLSLEKTTPEAEWRVLVIEDGDLVCGLLVEQSFGIMQFEATDRDESPELFLGNRLDPYLAGAFRASGRVWRVMELRTLVREPAFFAVAA